MNDYIKPADVHSPKRLWSLIAVLFDGGGYRPAEVGRPENPSSHSLAMGLWEGKPALVMRWNGNTNNPLGNPQSRGLPTWFVVPQPHWTQTIEPYRFPPDKLDFILNFLKMTHVYFVSACPNPSCRDYKQPALHQYRMNELGDILKQLEQDELKFYHIICDHWWKPSPREQAELEARLQEAWNNYRRSPK